MRRSTARIKSSSNRSGLKLRIKPFVILFLLALGLAAIPLFPSGGTEASAGKPAQRFERARLHDEIAIRAAGSGYPWINLTDGRDLLTDYSGKVELGLSLQSEQAAPLSLAAGDFDEDGIPDLVSAYAMADRGVITIHRGNIDSIYPDTPEARARKADGTFTDAPFLSPGLTFELSAMPELIEAGDFDADGHFDVVAATRGGSTIHLMVGDGRGALREARTLDLPGSITALASGEVNRPDGIPDLVVASSGASGPKLYVYEGPESAIVSEPEVFDLSSEANAIAIGHLGQDYTADIAVGAGRDLMVVHGRDRRLSLGEAARSSVPEAAITVRSFESEVTSLAIGDFTGDAQLELAALTGDGTVMLIRAKEPRGDLQLALARQEDLSVKTLAVGSGRGELMTARLSSLSHETVLMLDRAGRTLRVWMDDEERRERGDRTLAAASQGPSAPATLEVEGEPVAVLPMRLNMDGLSDLVILRKGMSGPSVTLTAPNSTITVCNTSDCGSIGCGSLRAAMAQANQSPGMDMIVFSGSFSGVPTIRQQG
ncbi:MAG TPA: VCBS repeat-containing protein, partial [Blastocatellia bacterium]|nr:VCBS repeat-containing protein [Blastocatellia bacterium]